MNNVAEIDLVDHDANYARLLEEEKNKPIGGAVSDGYHTFDELYAFRRVLTALLFNEWAKQGKYGVYKARKHHDGEACFGSGWFIVVAQLPSGQVSFHYEDEYWDEFLVDDFDVAPEAWDGHDANDSVERLNELL